MFQVTRLNKQQTSAQQQQQKREQNAAKDTMPEIQNKPLMK